MFIIKRRTMERLIWTSVVFACLAIISRGVLQIMLHRRAEEGINYARVNATITTIQHIRDPYKLKDCVAKYDLMCTGEALGIGVRNEDGIEWDELYIAEKLLERIPATGATIE